MDGAADGLGLGLVFKPSICKSPDSTEARILGDLSKSGLVVITVSGWLTMDLEVEVEVEDDFEEEEEVEEVAEHMATRTTTYATAMAS